MRRDMRVGEYRGKSSFELLVKEIRERKIKI
jgi:hypothetical protein